jgi:exo-1,4-beta-D-glucosaminidase
MPKVKVDSKMKVIKGERKTNFEVTLENKSDKIAFFIHSAIIDSKTGETFLPVLWSDNYISMLPGESRTLNVEIKNSVLEEKNTQLIIDGYNLKQGE